MQKRQNTQSAASHKLRPAALLFCVISVLASAQKPAPKPVQPLTRSTQLIVVTTPDWTATQGHLQRYQRATPRQPWEPVGPSIPIVVGKGGLGWGAGTVPIPDEAGPIKQEGDGRAPAGVFPLGTAFGYAPGPIT